MLTSFYDNPSGALVLVELLIHEFPHWARDLEVIRLEWEASASDVALPSIKEEAKERKGTP